MFSSLKFFILFLSILIIASLCPLKKINAIEVDYPSIYGKAPPAEITEYIVYIYMFAVAIAGFLAILMLIIGGIRLISSAGSPNLLYTAKRQIINALLGLFLIIFLCSIFALINPDLLVLKNPQLEKPPSDSTTNPQGGNEIGQIGQFDPPTNPYGYIYPHPTNSPDKGVNGTYCSDSGTDITVTVGTPVMAIANGTIEYIGIDLETCKAHMKDQWCYPPNTPGVARIKHDDGRSSYYAHLSAVDTTLKKGDKVQQGQIIGESGIANDSPHLHISIYENGNNFSPGKTERLWFSPPYNCPE